MSANFSTHRPHRHIACPHLPPQKNTRDFCDTATVFVTSAACRLDKTKSRTYACFLYSILFRLSTNTARIPRHTVFFPRPTPRATSKDPNKPIGDASRVVDPYQAPRLREGLQVYRGNPQGAPGWSGRIRASRARRKVHLLLFDFPYLVVA